jgi:hypothetical protein
MGYRGYGLPISELISEGNVGLMQALKRFEPPSRLDVIQFALLQRRRGPGRLGPEAVAGIRAHGGGIRLRSSTVTDRSRRTRSSEPMIAATSPSTIARMLASPSSKWSPCRDEVSVEFEPGYRRPVPPGPLLIGWSETKGDRERAITLAPNRGKSRVFQFGVSTGLRGGPGRTRTCNQTVMSG